MHDLPVRPRHPERTCWGCDKYCPTADLACGNGTIRAAHPAELFGDDWLEWSRRANRLPSADDEGDAGAPRADPAVSPRQS